MRKVEIRQFEDNGFVVVPGVVDGGQCGLLTERVPSVCNGDAGSRTLLDHAWCVELAGELGRHTDLCTLLPADAVAVQCTLFDKSPTKSWLVALHQDLGIPVKRRVEVAVRIHLDDCPEESGALRVVPRSHSEGRLTRERAEELRKESGETAVPVARGGTLVMRLPLELEWRWAV